MSITSVKAAKHFLQMTRILHMKDHLLSMIFSRFKTDKLGNVVINQFFHNYF